MSRLAFALGLLALGLLNAVLWIVESIQWQEWAIALIPRLSAEKAARYLSGEHLYRVRLAALLLSVLLAFLAWQYRRTARAFRLVWTGTQQGAESLLASWRQLGPTQQKVFGAWLLLAALSRFLLAWKMPVQLDEAFSYVFITRFGPLVTLSFYPGPNNHIGYLVWTALLSGWLEPQWALRLPSLLCAPLVSVLLLLFFRRFVPFSFAFAGVLLYEAEGLSVAYSVQGRGYWLAVLCTLWLAWLSFRLWERYQESTLAAWIAAAALGFWVMPVFLYPLSVLYFSLLFPGRIPFRHWVILPLLVGVVSSLLYLPALLLSGWKTLLANSWVQPMGFAEWAARLPAYIAGEYLGGEWFGVNVQFFWVGAVALALAFIKGRREEKALFYGFLLLPFLLMAFQQVLPFQRTWLLREPFLWLGVLAVARRVLAQWFREGRLVVGLVLGVWVAGQAVAGWHFLQTVAKSRAGSEALRERLKGYCRQFLPRPEDRFYVEDDAWQVLLRYDLLCAGADPGRIQTNVFSPATPYRLVLSRGELSRMESLMSSPDSSTRWQLIEEGPYYRLYHFSP